MSASLHESAKPTRGRFFDQHIVVTGAGSGIGRAIALRLASEGARLTLVGRRQEPLDETGENSVSVGGGGALVMPCDVRDRAQVFSAFDEMEKTMGKLHGVVANAGLGGPNFPGDDDTFSQFIDTNLVGTYHCLRAAQRVLVPSKEAQPVTRNMVVISSILGRIGVPAYTGYCASKTGLLGLVRALAAELATEHVQVNAICPGWVATDMARDGIEGMAGAMGVSYEEAHRIAMEPVPAGRMSKPDEIAGMVAWLMSPDAQGVTGQSLDMNGGAWM